MIVPTGKSAPQFSLSSTTGVTVHLHNLLQSDLLLLFFFKVNCPTCQFTVPFIERLYRSGLRTCGICQTIDEKQIKSFEQTYRISFPIAIEKPDYDVSNAYGIETVPTTFLLDSSGIVIDSIEAFDKAGFTALAEQCGKPSPFPKQENVPAFKAG